MLASNSRTRSIAMLGAGLLAAVGLWTQGYFLGALLVLLVVGGIATAKPELHRGKVVLKGTPIIAMFAIMFVSASGMALAIDKVTELFAPEAQKTECGSTTHAKTGSKTDKKSLRNISVY